MANVGTAAAGKTLVGAGVGSSPTYVDIGTNSGLTANGVVIAEGAGAFQATTAGTAGQVLMSNGPIINPSFQNGGSSFATTYQTDSGTASPALSILNILGLSGSKTSGSGSTLTIKSPPFSQIGASATSSLNTGEFVTAAVTRTLPVSAGLADGDLFIYVCTTANALVIQSVGAQKIRIGAAISSAAGTATSNAIGDSVTLRFNATDGFFYAVSVIGVWTLA